MHSTWIFWSNALICAALLTASEQALPNVGSAVPDELCVLPRHKLFDYPGATLALLGSECLVYGLTEDDPSHWAPFAIVTIALGVLFLAAFVGVECKISRPLVPMNPWQTPGFVALVSSYALGFSSYIAWQFYATRSFLDVQAVSPLNAGLYYLPNAIVGVLAAAARLPHISSPLAIHRRHGLLWPRPSLVPAQTSKTSYWALSMLGISLVTLGPDLSWRQLPSLSPRKCLETHRERLAASWSLYRTSALPL